MKEFSPANEQSEVLKQLVSMKMPFGKHKGWILYKLPEPYLVWFKHQGFPKGKLGVLLETIYEIKLNGLEELLDPLKKG